jgi:hypothetical protein
MPVLDRCDTDPARTEAQRSLRELDLHRSGADVTAMVASSTVGEALLGDHLPCWQAARVAARQSFLWTTSISSSVINTRAGSKIGEQYARKLTRFLAAQLGHGFKSS